MIHSTHMNSQKRPSKVSGNNLESYKSVVNDLRAGARTLKKSSSNCNSLLMQENPVHSLSRPMSPHRNSRSKDKPTNTSMSRGKPNVKDQVSQYSTQKPQKKNTVSCCFDSYEENKTLNTEAIDYETNKSKNLRNSIKINKTDQESHKKPIVMVKTDAFKNLTKSSESNFLNKNSTQPKSSNTNTSSMCTNNNNTCNSSSKSRYIKTSFHNILKNDTLERIKSKLMNKNSKEKNIQEESRNKSKPKQTNPVININHNFNHNFNHNIHININHHNSRSNSFSPLEPPLSKSSTNTTHATHTTNTNTNSNMTKSPNHLKENLLKSSINFKNLVNNFNSKVLKGLSPNPNLSFSKMIKKGSSNRNSDVGHITSDNLITDAVERELPNGNKLVNPSNYHLKNNTDLFIKRSMPSTTKNVCASEKIFEDAMSKNNLLNSNSKVNTSGSLLSEESIFASKKLKSKNNTQNSISFKQSQSMKHSSISSSNEKKASRSSSNKDLEISLSYTLSEDEGTLRSKRQDSVYSLTNKITDSEDFMKFYKEMNLKLFKYK